MNCTGNCNQGRTCTCTARQIVDHHTNERRAFISMESKRQQSIETLGDKWLLSPRNPNRPRKGHYNNFGVRIA